MKIHNFLNKRLVRTLLFSILSVLIAAGFADIVVNIRSIDKLNDRFIDFFQHEGELFAKQGIYLDDFIEDDRNAKKLIETVNLLGNGMGNIKLKSEYSLLLGQIEQIKILRKDYRNAVKRLNNDILKYTENNPPAYLNAVKTFDGFLTNEEFAHYIKNLIATSDISVKGKRLLTDDTKNIERISSGLISAIKNLKVLKNIIFVQSKNLLFASHRTVINEVRTVLIKILLLFILIFILFLAIVVILVGFRQRERNNTVSMMELILLFSERGFSNVNALMKKIADILDADIVSIGLTDKNSNILKYRYYYIRPKYQFIDLSDRKYWVDIDRYATGATKAKGKAIVVNRYQSFPDAHKEWKSAGLRTFMGMPLYDESGNYFGQFSANRFTGYSFTKYDLIRFRLFGQIILNLYDKEQKTQKLGGGGGGGGGGVKSGSAALLRILKKAEDALEADTLFFYDKDENLLYANRFSSSINLDSLENTDKKPTNGLYLINLKKDEIKRCERILFEDKNLLLSTEPLKTEKRCYGSLIAFYKNSEDKKMKSLSLKIIAQNMLLELINFDIKAERDFIVDTYESQVARLLISSMEIRDSYTRGHSERVALYSEFLGRVYGLNDEEIDLIKTAALFHDIGKIGIPDMILLKPGKLTREEYRIIQLHPVISAKMIKSIKQFEPLVPIIRHHHERWDGKGYPDGLKGEEIPREACIIAIADVIDAVSTTRPYRDAFSDDQTRQLISKGQGKQFDPEIAAIVLDNFTELQDYARIHEGLYPKPEIAYPELDIWRSLYFDIDYRTGLLRPEAFNKGLAKFQKEGRPFRLFLIDLDNISEINRKFGVTEGDKLIVSMASSLNSLQSRFGIRNLARHGGDSFAFIILKEDLDESDSIEKIDSEIAGILEKTGISFQMTSSDFPEITYPLHEAEKMMREIRKK